MGKSGNSEARLPWTKRIIANPWTGLLVGLGIGVIGIIVTIALYHAGQTERGLSYMVNPVRTSVVVSGEATALEILHDGEPLGNVDVTAVQIAIWNSGDESIKQEDILEGIVVSTNPSVYILEASIRKTSRNVTQFAIQDSPQSLANGTVPISWRILESGDGASIQLVYIGQQNVDILLQGTIEGIREMKRIELGAKIETPAQQLQKTQKDRQRSLTTIYVCAPIVFVGVVTLIVSRFVSVHKKRWLLQATGLCLAGSPLAILIFSLIEYLGSKSDWPPFGF